MTKLLIRMVLSLTAVLAFSVASAWAWDRSETLHASASASAKP